MDSTSLKTPKYKALVEEKQFETYFRLINPPAAPRNAEILLLPKEKICSEFTSFINNGGGTKKKRILKPQIVRTENTLSDNIFHRFI